MEDQRDLARRVLEFRRRMLALDAKWEGNVPQAEAEAILQSNRQLIKEISTALFSSQSVEEEEKSPNWPEYLAYYVIPAIHFFTKYNVPGRLQRIELRAWDTKAPEQQGPALLLTIDDTRYTPDYDTDFMAQSGEPEWDLRKECAYAAEAIWAEYTQANDNAPAQDMQALLDKLRQAFPEADVAMLPALPYVTTQNQK